MRALTPNHQRLKTPTKPMAPGRSPALPGRRRRRRGRHRWSTPREPRPQLPCSPSSPDPSPTGDGETGLLLPAGADVEVRLDGKGYYGTWFEATVVGFAAARGRHAPARYSVTFDGDGDGERPRRFAPTHVRPRSPAAAPESPPLFRPHDVVEAFHERGWWSGIVLSAAPPKSVTVAFPITREVITYMPRLVRPRRDYVDGEWVPSRTVVAVRPEHEIKRYEVGEAVEALREREAYGHSWFPAKVAKLIDEFSYIVEYSDQNGEEGGGSEYLHWRFIRPAVQHLPRENEFHLQLGPGAAVEAYCDGAWSAGLVHTIDEDGEFVVRINGKQGKQLMTKAVEFLKPQHKWDGKDWSIVMSAKRQANFRQALASGKRPKSHVEVPSNVDEHSHDPGYSCAKRSMREPQQKLAVLVEGSEIASVSKMGTPLSALESSLTSICPPNSCSSLYGHSTHTKIVAPDNVQNHLEKKNPLLRKVYTLKKRLSKKKEGFEGPLESPSMGQKIGVNEIAGPQREPSLVLERPESTQQQLDSTLEDTMNANEVKDQEPVAVVPLSFESASDDIGIHGSKFDEGLTAQNNRITDVITHNSHTQVPFVKNSCLWSAAEGMDVFKEFPQQPHFLPLQECPDTLRGGMALGMMVAFDLFVGSMSKSNITDNEGSFEEKQSTLAALKANGFDVHYFECLLDELIKVKFEYSKHLEEKSAVQTQKQETMSSLSRNDSLLCDIDNDIAELEKKLGLLRQKGQLIEKEKEHDKEYLSRLNEVESSIEEALDVDTLQFNGILAEVKQKRLT